MSQCSGRVEEERDETRRTTQTLESGKISRRLAAVKGLAGCRNQGGAEKTRHIFLFQIPYVHIVSVSEQ